VTDQVLLRAENISKGFPGVQALNEVSFEVYEGEVHGLVGENGAGKTTLVHVLSGAHQRDSGHIYYGGAEVELRNPHEAARLGIAVVHQEAALAPNLSVADNIFLGHIPASGVGFIRQEQMDDEARRLLASLGIEMDVRQNVEYLTSSEQQLVEIAKALSYRARLVMMDEPNSSLAAMETERLFETIERLRKEGMAIVFVSHRLNEVFHICDRITILRDGRRIATVDTDATSIEAVIQMMVGREMRVQPRARGTVSGEPILEVEGLERGEDVNGVSFTLHEGEILGFAGLVGAGRTAMAMTLFGALAATAGEVSIDGERVHISSPMDAVEQGIGFVPEDKKLQGLFLNMAVRENVSMAILPELARAGFLDQAKERAVVSEYVDRLAIQTPSIEQTVANLSGGNQQKVVMSRWLAMRPKVLILDEPTQGIDVGAKAEIHDLISDLAAQGMGIILISSELPELLALSDRLLVMKEGRIVGEYPWTEALSEDIMRSALQGAVPVDEA
jgi:ribose transport system ATP-binding protein